MIGNDIVDLQYLERPPYQHIRYLERVCAPGEANAVRESSNPARSLAAVWAAKEAAYKLLARSSNLTHFVPREFVTDFAHCNSLPYSAELYVSHYRLRARVRIYETTQWLHAVAMSPRCGKVQWRVQEIEKDSHREITPADESAAVRQLAKELLQECGMKNVMLQFVGKIPTPRKAGALDGEEAISLSHHGRFVAAAIAWSSNELLDEGEAISTLSPSASTRAA